MTQNPLTAMFEAQRTAVEGSQQLTHETMEAGAASFSAMADMFSSSESLAESNAEMTKNAYFAFFDALEASLPEGAVPVEDFRKLVDESVDAASQTQREMLEATVESLEESGAAYEEYTEGYAEVVDSSFESFLELHEGAEENVGWMVESTEEMAEEFETAA